MLDKENGVNDCKLYINSKKLEQIPVDESVCLGRAIRILSSVNVDKNIINNMWSFMKNEYFLKENNTYI